MSIEIFPSTSSAESLSPLKIKPNFGNPDGGSFISFLSSVENILNNLIPPALQEELLETTEEKKLRKLLCDLCKMLPLFSHTPLKKTPCTLSIATLCHSDYTDGLGRYFCDMLSRWLIPGKQLPLLGGRSLSFRFVKYDKQPLYFCEQFVKISDPLELEIIKKSLPKLLNEMKINIVAVYYARYIVSLKSLSLRQKTVMIQDHIESLVNSPEKIKDSNIYDQMQQFLIKLSAEEKFREIKKNISRLIHTRPKTFDRDVFFEIRNFMSLFRDKFTASRDPRHVSRVIAYQYLFKKNILASLEKDPMERHLSFKLLQTQYLSSKVLGILITLHFIRETERFEKRHILEAIHTILPSAQFVKDSYVQGRSDEKVRSFYLEVEKPQLSIEEIRKLKKLLPKELKTRVENVIHPIFMPRNEEELMRNMVLLSKQLKYSRDLPQAIISYDRQNDEELSFQIVLARVLKPKNLALKDILKNTGMKFSLDEVKKVGYVKQYPKEVGVFHFSLKKQPFFRKDFSLDLQKARQHTVQVLMSALGEFRDFNGGMIIKQNEALDSLRSSLLKEEKENEFLLENFFYSLKPAFMQSVLETKIIKTLFLMLLEALEKDFSSSPYFLKTETLPRYCLIILSTSNADLKKDVLQEINKLDFSSGNLTVSELNTYEISTLGFIQRVNLPETSNLLLETISKVLTKWAYS